ncbi:hypothetical protein [Chloroflexus sp.]|uniref:hypothetical protein n=1 Tax=Chloroflexus sp. TaxID=1904827 RepID=UPI002ACEF9ED|nr:hypothetical protein [Chloroflexus sp.]
MKRWIRWIAAATTFSAGGSYTLGSTIGQADAGVASGGSYTLYGGFWGSPDSMLYIPLVTR